MQKIKVLMTAPLPKDRGGSYTTGICKVAYALSKQKFEHSILYISSTNIAQDKAEKLCEYDHQYNGYNFSIFNIIKPILLHPLDFIKELYFYKHKCHVNPFRFFFYRINVEQHIHIIKPDIIHVNTTEAPAVIMANKSNIPMIDTMHGVFYRGEANQSDILDRFNHCIKQFDFFTGLTEECRVLMTKLLGIDDKRLVIIPNGINTEDYYYDSNERSKLRARLNLRNEIVFITVASVQERKGQLEFIKILRNLDINWKYWIVGTGPDLEKIKEYCLKNNLTDKVLTLGHIESKNLYKYYSAADIYAHTSTMEGQSLSEMEAYASGLKIIFNLKVKDTIVTNTLNSNIYYGLDMTKVNYTHLKDWISRPQNDRKSRKSINWQDVAIMYDNFYNNINNKNKYGKV